MAYTEDEVKADLARRYDSYNNVKKILEAKESTLKAKQSEIVAFRKQLETMMAQKKELTTKLDEIEATLRQIEATQATNEFQLRRQRPVPRQGDGLRPGEAARGHGPQSAEMEGRYAETGVPVILNPSRDVVKEIDAEFGQPTGRTSGSKTAGKSL